MSGTNGKKPSKNGKADSKPKNGSKPGPKPWTPTEKQVKEIGVLAGVLNMEQMADYFGISHDTFEAAKKRDEQIARAYKEGRASAVRDVGNSLLAQARKGNIGAICFYLKTQAGYRETQRVEHTGADGDAIEIAEVAAEARRAVVGRLAGIAARITENRLAQKPQR